MSGEVIRTVDSIVGVGSATRLAIRSATNGRENNEDDYLVFDLRPDLDAPPVTILSIADGMGGLEHGELASRETLRKLGLSLFEQFTFGRRTNGVAGPVTARELETMLLNAVQEANAHVKRMVNVNRWGKAGSTVVAVAVTGAAAVVVNMGDSPLFRLRADADTLERLTDDHTIAGIALRAGLITSRMARVHEGRSRLEYYIGGSAMPRTAPIRTFDLAPGDILLLCSDGISGAVSEDQIHDILKDAGSHLSEAADHLLHASIEAGETDNQTVILWKYVPLHRPPALELLDATPVDDTPGVGRTDRSISLLATVSDHVHRTIGRVEATNGVSNAAEDAGRTDSSQHRGSERD